MSQDRIKEIETWCIRLIKLSADEALAVLGKPTRRYGRSGHSRYYEDGSKEEMDYVRGFEFDGLGETFQVLRIDERPDGRLHISFLPAPTVAGQLQAEPNVPAE